MILASLACSLSSPAAWAIAEGSSFDDMYRNPAAVLERTAPATHPAASDGISVIGDITANGRLASCSQHSDVSAQAFRPDSWSLRLDQDGAGEATLRFGFYPRFLVCREPQPGKFLWEDDLPLRKSESVVVGMFSLEAHIFGLPLVRYEEISQVGVAADPGAEFRQALELDHVLSGAERRQLAETSTLEKKFVFYPKAFDLGLFADNHPGDGGSWYDLDITLSQDSKGHAILKGFRVGLHAGD
jgi:hypothetical protein